MLDHSFSVKIKTQHVQNPAIPECEHTSGMCYTHQTFPASAPDKVFIFKLHPVMRSLSIEMLEVNFYFIIERVDL